MWPLANWYRLVVYIIKRRSPMAKSGLAKLFRNGHSQAVRLPREFRFEGDAVRVRRGAAGGFVGARVSGGGWWGWGGGHCVGGEILKKSRKKARGRAGGE